MSETVTPPPTEPYPAQGQDKAGNTKRPTRAALSIAVSLLLCIGVFHVFFMPRYSAILAQTDAPLPNLTLFITGLPRVPVLVLAVLGASGLCLKELIPGLDRRAAIGLDRGAMLFAWLLATAYIVGLSLPLKALS